MTPDHRTAAAAAFVLAELDVDARSDGLGQIADAIHSWALSQGWTASKAVTFSLDFTHAVADQVDEMLGTRYSMN